MSKAWVLKVDEYYPFCSKEISQHDSYEEAEKEAERLFDAGQEGDFLIVEAETGRSWCIPDYTLHKKVCPVCGKEVRHRDFRLTRDCHGIPYRLVCFACFRKIMDGLNGYDGEYYTEANKYLDEDY